MSDSPNTSPIIKRSRKSKMKELDETELIPPTPEKLQPKRLFILKREVRLKAMEEKNAMEREKKERKDKEREDKVREGKERREEKDRNHTNLIDAIFGPDIPLDLDELTRKWGLEVKMGEDKVRGDKVREDKVREGKEREGKERQEEKDTNLMDTIFGADLDEVTRK